jgi:hypothetical protein
MTKPGNEDKFVTFKQLLMALGGVFGIVLTIFALYLAHVNTKVSKEVYDRDHRELCSDVDEIKTTVEKNATLLDRFGRNQELVLRALKIQPVDSK